MGKTADVTGDRFYNSRVASHEPDRKAVVTFTNHGVVTFTTDGVD
ncbi:MAG: hypothetical protein V7K50_29955 [Nostoc sp.]